MNGVNLVSQPHAGPDAAGRLGFGFRRLASAGCRRGRGGLRAGARRLCVLAGAAGSLSSAARIERHHERQRHQADRHGEVGKRRSADEPDVLVGDADRVHAGKDERLQIRRLGQLVGINLEVTTVARVRAAAARRFVGALRRRA